MKYEEIGFPLSLPIPIRLKTLWEIDHIESEKSGGHMGF